MKRLLYPVLLGLGLAACGQSSNEASSSADAVAPETTAAAPTPGTAPAEPTVAPSTPARQIIYRATLDLRVADLPRAAARVDSLAQATGSWVSEADQARTEGEWRQETTIRVRPAQFAPLLAALSALGSVEGKTLASEDVTTARADVAARLRAKRAVEQRYLALLAQARNISEVLEVEAKIAAGREDIEATESRLKALDEQLAYSTITLRLYQPLPLSAPEAPLLSLSSRLTEAFYGGWSLITGLVVGAVYLWPLLLLGAAALGLLRRRRSRSHPA
ncbi:DUF4349 domain-containing protein [Hymenobacter sp. B81]|uniref:DUF4349 domain-containing protein n=1 Tax=Hymenobacter sp. B81 TaxID=3344878 RepID=UPI0037DC0439